MNTNRAFQLGQAILIPLCGCACVFAGLSWPAQAAAADRPAPGRYAAVPAARDPGRLGAGVQRTLTLLATSTPERRNTVRILFYGQSITEQEWWKDVADDLRSRFPSANLIIENRAIGGFASQRLIKPAEHDVYPFYPDLMILHVYGSNGEYEQLVRNTRSLTTAEVLMLTDHLTQWPPAVIDEKKDKGSWWDDFMNRLFLPETARKYGCGLADNRGAWIDYLKANHLEPRALLKDGVHLNDHGNYLMAELVKRYLVYRPELGNASWRGLVRTVELGAGREPSWNDGVLKLEFEGNRVDLIADPGLPADSARSRIEVRIDGKKPSEFPGAYAITRPTPPPWSPLALTRVDHEASLVIEPWTLSVTSVGAESKTWTFSVAGDRTGPDGEGQSDQLFRSKSGRVKIAPESWFRGFGKDPVPKGYTIRWQVVPRFTDVIEAPEQASDPGIEPAVTAVQGIPNTRHVLELRGEGGGGNTPQPSSLVRAIRVFRPSVPAAGS
jgi:hypothetical protein